MARPGPEGGQYQPLTEEQIRQIHQASLTVLEHTGIHVENEEALALYRQGGARVDGNRVHITQAMIEKALETVPARVLLAGRDPEQDVVLEDKRVYAGTGGSPTMVLDPGADTVRPPCGTWPAWPGWPTRCSTATSSSFLCTPPTSPTRTCPSTAFTPA